MDNRKEKLEALKADEEFMNKLASAEGNKAIAEILAAYGIAMSEEEVAEAMSARELDETDLQEVSGGLNILQLNPAYWITKWIVSKALESNGVCK